MEKYSDDMRWTGLVTLLTCTLVAGCATTITGSAVPAAGGTALDCAGGKVVEPKGAPYCYLLPTGFTDVSNAVTLQYQSANPGRYISAIEVAKFDTITVSVYPLRADSDTVSSGDLSAAIVSALPDPTSTGIRSGTPTMTTLAGARAVRVTVQSAGQYASTAWFAFRGYTEVEVDCQWAQHQDQIDQGCAGVRNTLRFVDPPR